MLQPFLEKIHCGSHSHFKKRERSKNFGIFHWQSLLGLGIASVSCAPVGSSTKESKQTPAGVLEEYSIVFHLSPSSTQAAATNGTPITNPTSSTKPTSTLNLLNTATPAPGAAASHPPLKYCFEIPKGSTISAPENKYNCRFFEYITAVDGGGAAKDQMKKRVWEPDPTNPNSPKGIPASCQFGANLQSLALGCEYRVIDNGKETTYPCSSYKDNVSVGGKLDDFVQIKASGGNFTLEALPQSGNSDAGTPLPAVTFSGMIKGSCAAGDAASIGFPKPDPSQLVDSPDGQPGSPTQSANPNAPQNASAGGKVKFSLNTAKVSGKTALKTSTAQSDPKIEGDSSSQCTIKEIEAGNTILVALLGAGKTVPDEQGNHYVVAGLESVKVNGVEVCPNFIKSTTTAKSKIYLFKDHWTKN